jgi:general secretion pathway protein C
MTARLSAFFVWALLAACAVFWGLRIGGSSPVAPAHTVPVGEAALPRVELSRLFGAEPVAKASEVPEAAASSRFHLIGVVANKVEGGPGIALIAIDDKPARPFRLGAEIDGDLVLQAVEARGVSIGPRGGAATVRLDLPPLPPAAVGSLPPAVSNFGAAAAPPMPTPMPAPAQMATGNVPVQGAPLSPSTMPRPLPRQPMSPAAIQQPQGAPGTIQPPTVSPIVPER